ncbi:hypothetical protein RHSIM_Rhsim02G0003400 [Rhododendron simsii]|uniref:GDSL esterase/lipase n=1 Tax=Rhododendron simsii TaxID=118357 RepID=A0A834LUC4_RHOSS|nr:hypothetical protein RHSIM_Rhsim02G0003400 [Rhododendron simsii]
MGILLGIPTVGIAFQILTVLALPRLCLADNVPANFVFGDSLVEVGNNNYIVSLSKANFIPNGIDFGNPTGRYTNGRTIVDIVGKFLLCVTPILLNCCATPICFGILKVVADSEILILISILIIFYLFFVLFFLLPGQEIGLKDFTPPYLDPTTTGPVVLQGVSYASGGGGILNHTGKIFGGRINLDAQMDNFANTRQDIISSIGSPAAMKLFNRALYSITMGSNDFINNYLVPVLSTVEQKLISPQMFVDALISRFRLQLTRLYNMGARKIIVVNVGPIGCIPYQREINPSAGENCVAFPNELAQMFNAPLKDLVAELSANLKGATFVYADVYHIVDDIVQNYKSYGFEIANSACCAVAGKFGGLIPCGPNSKVCLDRSKYVFWDPYHPTDATNVIIAKRLMDGDSDDISPVNIRRLMKS